MTPYIAVDDISFSSDCNVLDHGPTEPPNVTTENPDHCLTIYCANSKGKFVCLDEMQICDFVKDCANGFDEQDCGPCTFNNETLCGWRNNEEIDHQWVLISPASEAPAKMQQKDADENPLGGYAAITDTTKQGMALNCLKFKL